MKVVKNEGLKEEFDDEKLYDSAYYPAREAALDKEEANDIAEKVVWEVKSWMSDHEDEVFSSEEIRQKVLEILRDVEQDVAFLYRTHLDIN
ncbi:MAG: ATP cone domain-containing protein [Candidatus Nanohaloarchaea archaeon]